VEFLTKKVEFLTKKVEFLTKKVEFLTKKVEFLTGLGQKRQPVFLASQKILSFF